MFVPYDIAYLSLLFSFIDITFDPSHGTEKFAGHADKTRSKFKSSSLYRSFIRENSSGRFTSFFFLLHRSFAEDIALRKKQDDARWGMQLGVNKAFRQVCEFYTLSGIFDAGFHAGDYYCSRARETFTLATHLISFSAQWSGSFSQWRIRMK